MQNISSSQLPSFPAPEPIIQHILTFLDYRELDQTAQVCKDLFKLSYSYPVRIWACKKAIRYFSSFGNNQLTSSALNILFGNERDPRIKREVVKAMCKYNPEACYHASLKIFQQYGDIQDLERAKKSAEIISKIAESEFAHLRYLFKASRFFLDLSQFYLNSDLQKARACANQVHMYLSDQVTSIKLYLEIFKISKDRQDLEKAKENANVFFDLIILDRLEGDEQINVIKMLLALFEMSGDSKYYDQAKACANYLKDLTKSRAFLTLFEFTKEIEYLDKARENAKSLSFVSRSTAFSLIFQVSKNKKDLKQARKAIRDSLSTHFYGKIFEMFLSIFDSSQDIKDLKEAIRYVQKIQDREKEYTVFSQIFLKLQKSEINQDLKQGRKLVKEIKINFYKSLAFLEIFKVSKDSKDLVMAKYLANETFVKESGWNACLLFRNIFEHTQDSKDLDKLKESVKSIKDEKAFAAQLNILIVQPHDKEELDRARKTANVGDNEKSIMNNLLTVFTVSKDIQDLKRAKKFLDVSRIKPRIPYTDEIVILAVTNKFFEYATQIALESTSI